MDGLLVIDKPAGPTSHDVVARIRRVLGERRVGHTGTLDPAASGVLPLVVGRATRLARFLSAADKHYDAVVRLGIATDTFDADGQPAPAHAGPLPDRAAIDGALDAFRGRFEQRPPAFSAKKIGGRRSYAIARARRATLPAAGADESQPPDLPAPVSVTAHAITITELDGDVLSLHVHCSAGFYVRALAHDLGERLAVGAHLMALRRTASGESSLAGALPLDLAERDPGGAIAALLPLSGMLTAMPSVVLTEDGVRRAAHGSELGLDDRVTSSRRSIGEQAQSPTPPHFRLLDQHGDLVGIGEPTAAPGVLHPSVVLV